MIRFEAVTFLLNQQVQGDQITVVRGLQLRSPT